MKNYVTKATMALAIIILANIIKCQNGNYLKNKITKDEIFATVRKNLTVQKDLKHSQYIIDVCDKEFR